MTKILNNTPTKEEEEQAKEFLSRTEVRTMKKDIQILREGVALKERERIIKLKTPEEELEKIRIEKAKREEAEKQSQIRTKIVQKKSEGEEATMDQLKNFAKEDEKQQIFYLESEKVNLEKQLQTLQREKESPMLLEKNKFLLERDAVEERLKPIIEEEKKTENEQKFISESEKTANVPKDKQKLEKRRWELEEKREKIEKSRWTIERELEKAESGIKEIDDEYKKLLTDQETLKDRIAEINDSLKSIYLGIMSREEEKRRLKEEQSDVESLEQAKKQEQRKEEIRRQEWSGKKDIQEKPFLKEVPNDSRKENLIKKIQETTSKEEEQRRNFLKGIKEWEEKDKEQK